MVWNSSLIARPGRYTRFLYSLGFISTLMPLGYGLYRGLYAQQYYGIVAVFFWSRMWLGLSLLALMIFLTLLSRHWRRKRIYAAIHKNGIKLSSSKPKYLTWSQIFGISAQEIRKEFIHIPIKKEFRAVLYPNVGPAINLHPALPNLPELASRVKAAIYPRRSSELTEDFQTGKWLYFGPLAIQKNAFRSGKREIPWNSIHKIDVQRGFLILHLRESSNIRVPVIKIPNFEILLEIIQKRVTH